MADEIAPRTTSSVQRFHYASFGEAEARPSVKPVKETAKTSAPVPTEPQPIIIQPMFTEQDVNTARNEGYKKGFNEGSEKAQTEEKKKAAAHEDTIQGLLETVANRVTIAAEDHANYLKEQQTAMGQLTLAIARKLAGDALKREPYSHIESLLRECMALIIGQQEVTLFVTPDYKDGLKQRIDMLKPLLQGFDGVLKVEEDPALSVQDCRVEWKNGHAECNHAVLWNEIEAIIARASTH